LAEGDDLATVRYTHIPLPVFLANREAVLSNPHPLGLLVSPGEKVEDAAADLGRFASVAISFPAFGDGRGYSTARLVVERYKFAGEVRAVGDVLADQIPLMRRCGINAFVVKTSRPARRSRTARSRRSTCSTSRSGVTEVPVGTRPFLRRAVEKVCIPLGRPPGPLERRPN
jgi:phosphoadenosine phosphosulfate reductase